MTSANQHPARFDESASAVLIEHLAVRDADTVREAQRWTTGERGPQITDTEQLAEADLTNYVTEALRIGAHALSVTGQAQESRALERMLRDVGEKTASSTAKAAEDTGRVVKDASETVTKAAGDAKKAITEVDNQSRKAITDAVTGAKQDLHTELQRIFGGDNPDLIVRLKPVLEKFASDLDTKVNNRTSELITKAAKQFDPSDPASPMAKHAETLRSSQQQLTERLDQNHVELKTKVDNLSTALKVQEAKAALTQVTPIKGGDYEERVHTLMLDIAGGLGDEYSETGNRAGHLPRNKKGDGVLTVDGGTTRLVVEMTSSERTAWTGYLDEAERNRDAAASLGLVPTSAQNGNQTVRVIGDRRIILAFDPETDEPELLRTVVMLLRTAALAAATRKGTQEIATAEEKITEALAELGKIDSVKKLAGQIQTNAEKIDKQCGGLNTGIRRLLDQALAALAGVDTGSDAVGQHGAA